MLIRENEKKRSDHSIPTRKIRIERDEKAATRELIQRILSAASATAAVQEAYSAQ